MIKIKNEIIKNQKNYWNAAVFHPTDAVEDPWGRRILDRISEDGALKTVLFDILDTPVSPELLPTDNKGDIAQKTEDLVGPYELHDFFLYHFVRWGETPEKIYREAQAAFEGRFDDETIEKWINIFFRRFYSQQFKRSALPDGPRVGSVAFSPRGAWIMPSDACGWEMKIEK